MPKRGLCFSLVIIFLIHHVSQAQPAPSSPIRTAETLPPPPSVVHLSDHSPLRATLYSTILPGWGQAYNKQKWKIPIIYAGLITSTFFIFWNLSYRNEWQGVYESFLANIVETDIPESARSSLYWTYLKNNHQFRETTLERTLMRNSRENNYVSGALQDIIKTYNSWLNWSYVSLGIFYLLNIIDANVYAHLFYFSVSNDLSLRLQPTLIKFRNTLSSHHLGVSLTLNFR